MMMVDGEVCLLNQKSKKGIIFHTACNWIAYPQEGSACDFLQHGEKVLFKKHIQRMITNDPGPWSYEYIF